MIDGTPQGLNAAGQNYTAANTNPYEGNIPVTNRTVSQVFTITRGTIAPDGFNKSCLLVNGAFPGPTLEANWGDMFEITVQNRITGPEEGTSLHWHGLLQKTARGMMACLPSGSVQLLRERISHTNFKRGSMGLVGITRTIVRSMLMDLLVQ